MASFFSSVYDLFIDISLLSLEVSAVALLAFFMLRFFGKKISHFGKKLIWIVIIFRLLLPLTILPNFSFFKVELPPEDIPEDTVTPDMQETRPPLTDTDTYSPDTADTEQNSPADTSSPVITDSISDSENLGNTPEIPTDNNDPEKTKSKLKLPNVKTAFALIWATIGSMLFLWRIIGYFFFLGECKRWAVGLAEDSEISAYEECCEALNIKKRPKVFYTRVIDTPLLCGFIKKKIYLPENIQKDNLPAVFSHELMHCRRGDTYFKLLFTFIRSVYWFNPAIYIAINICEHEIELSCDEGVLKGENSDRRKLYGRVVIDTARSQEESRKKQ